MFFLYFKFFFNKIFVENPKKRRQIHRERENIKNKKLKVKKKLKQIKIELQFRSLTTHIINKLPQ
jgi:hypothetical protein